MSTTKKTEAAIAAEAAKTATAPAAEKKDAPAKKAPAKKAAAAKKPAAKKTAAKKTAAKKTAAKESAVTGNVYVEYLGAQISSADLIEKAKKASGVKSPKEINVYVKPEDNKVYYVVDKTAGDFELV